LGMKKLTKFWSISRYLGQTLSFQDRIAKELKIRRANGWKAFWAKKAVWRSKLRIRSKIKVFKSMIIPVLTYSCQTWETTNKQMEKFQTTQNAMLRKILGLKRLEKTRNEELFKKTKAKIIWGVAKKLKYRYAGHVIRESKQKWNNILTTLVPYTGKRGRGWPRMRWSDELIKVFGKG